MLRYSLLYCAVRVQVVTCLVLENAVKLEWEVARRELFRCQVEPDSPDHEEILCLLWRIFGNDFLLVAVKEVVEEIVTIDDCHVSKHLVEFAIVVGVGTRDSVRQVYIVKVKFKRPLYRLIVVVSVTSHRIEDSIVAKSVTYLGHGHCDNVLEI